MFSLSLFIHPITFPGFPSNLNYQLSKALATLIFFSRLISLDGHGAFAALSDAQVDASVSEIMHRSCPREIIQKKFEPVKKLGAEVIVRKELDVPGCSEMVCRR